MLSDATTRLLSLLFLALAAIGCGERRVDELDPDALALDLARYTWDGPGAEARVSGLRYFGLPIEASPMDLFALQEILAELRPELVIQSGGSAGAAFYVAHLLETLRPAAVVLFIDPNPRVAEQLAQIRPPPIRDRVRALFERRIEIIAARATAPELAATLIPRAQGKVTLAMLDSCHNVDHVKRELALLAPLVSLGSYVIVQDTLIDRRPEWISRRASCDGDVRAGGPLLAVQEFLDEHPEFQADRSREKLLTTWNPSGYLRRIR